MLTGLHDVVRHAPAPLPADLGCAGPLTVGSSHGCLLCRRWSGGWGGAGPSVRWATSPEPEPTRRDPT
jgi:hypothetical protein